MTRIKDVFITGGTGFLGSHIVEQLLEEGGYRITAMHRPGSDLSFLRQKKVRLVEGDLQDAAGLEAIVPEGVDLIFHTAANTSLWRGDRQRQYRDNVRGTANLLQAAASRKAGRFVYTSSIMSYGLHDITIDEDTVSTAMDSPISYVRSKHAAEQQVREAGQRGMETVILKPGTLIGPRDKNNMIQLFEMVAGGRLPGVPAGTNSFAHVRDVARAHIAATAPDYAGREYVLGGVNASMAELAQTAVEVIGQPLRVRELPRPAMLLWAHMLRPVGSLTRRAPTVTPEMVTISTSQVRCSSARARRDLRYRIGDLREMVDDCWQWMQQRESPPAPVE